MMEDLLLKIIWDVALFLIMIGIGMLVAWLKNNLGVEAMRRVQAEWENIQLITKLAIKYAEQAYRNYGGAKKKEAALAFLSRELAQLGLKVSTETMSDLIEAILREIKDELGEEWAKAIEDDSNFIEENH